MNAKCLLLFSLLSWGGWVHAEQGCAPGFTLNASGTPGGPMCIPISGYGTTNNTTPPQASGPRWQLTWGAIAMDNTTGDSGVTVGHFSGGKAKREAMLRCAEFGAKRCKIVLAYKNQCAVVVTAAKHGKSVAGPVIAQGGPSIDVARQSALSACTAQRGGGECGVVYSDCTPPVLVQN